MNVEKALAKIDGQLRPGEHIVETAKTSLRETDARGRQTIVFEGVAAVTTHRLIFAGSYLFERSDLSVPVSSIDSVVSRRRHLVWCSVVTATDGAEYWFDEFPPDFERALARRRLAPSPSQRPRPKPGRPAQLPIDQLAQLAQLHLSGELTDAEFAAAKAILLDA